MEKVEDNRILIVDDDADVRELMNTICTEAGYKTYAVEDGLAGLECFQENTIDLVITDIHMPKMSGLELIQKLRHIDPSIRILAISGDNQDAHHGVLDWAEAAGAFEILEKPFEVDEFIGMIKMIISSEL